MSKNQFKINEKGTWVYNYEYDSTIQPGVMSPAAVPVILNLASHVERPYTSVAFDALQARKCYTNVGAVLLDMSIEQMKALWEDGHSDKPAVFAGFLAFTMTVLRLEGVDVTLQNAELASKSLKCLLSLTITAKQGKMQGSKVNYKNFSLTDYFDRVLVDSKPKS
jgi:hypothetical protein